MPYKLDFSIAASDQIEAALCQRLETIRLARNITQAQLAQEAGVSLRTIVRLEKGEGVTFDTWIRVLMALGIQQNLINLLPDPSIRPIERTSRKGSERKRARPRKKPERHESWSWDDDA